MNISQISQAATTIRNQRLLGQYSEGTAYIATLPPNVRHSALVVIESAGLHLVQGKFGHAVRTLDSCYLPDLPQGNELILGCLALMKCYAITQRECKVFAAWEEAAKIRKTLLEPGLGFSIDPEIPEREITKNFEHLGTRNKDEKEDKETISRIEVLVVFWYHRIAIIAADQAIINPSKAKSCARQHLDHVMSTLRSQKRIEEERMLLHVYIETLPSMADKANSLKSFLEASNENDLQQGLSYLDLASCSIEVDFDSQEHIQHLMKASLLLEASGHRHGHLDTHLLWISEGQGKTTCAETAPERVQKLQEIANRYSEHDYPLGEIRALFQAAKLISLSPEQPELSMKSCEIDSRLVELSIDNEATFIRRTHHVYIVAQLIKHEVDSGSILQTLSLMLEENKSELLPKTMGIISHMIAICYESLGNNSKALEYETESLRYHKMGKDYTEISDSVLALALRAKGLALSSASYPLLEKLREATELLEEWVIKDEEAGYLEGASDKYKQLALLELHRNQFLGISGAYQTFILWREKMFPLRHGLNEAIIIQLIMDLIIDENYTTAAEFSLEVLQYLREIGSSQEKITNIEFWFSICFIRIAETAKQAALASDNPGSGDGENTLEGLESFPDGIEVLESVFAYHERSNTVSATVWSAVMLARAHRNLSPKTSSEMDQVAAFRKINEFFLRAESKCDELRQQIWTFNGLQALLDKRQVVSKETHRLLYSGALEDCLEAGEICSAWVWVQKGKARGLADMLGAQYNLPLYWLNRLEGDSEALKLMAEERQLAEEASSAKTSTQAIACRRFLKLHHGEMRKNPLLAQYLSARGGAFDLISLDSIFNSLSSAYIPPNSKIVLIDWIILKGGKIAMMTVDSRKQPLLYQLEITITVVEKWLRDHFKFVEGEEPDLHQTGADRILSKLNSLVEKLKECTNESDLLILSPTGLLHQLPLHALRVDGKILLDRNLVVYSSSLSVLRSCLDRSKTKIVKSSHQQPTKPVFFGVYEEEEHFAERRHIFDCVKTEAVKASAPYSLGPEVTRARVLEAVKEADWIHFHGHARYDRQNILEQGLVLSDGVDIFLNFDETEEDEEDEEGSGEDETEENNEDEDEDEEDAEVEDQESNEDLFQIPDIFTLKLDATHLTLVACDSGVQQIEPGDEPLGIISAFLVAGAASAVGTLWPTLSPAGRAFTKAFYENLRYQKEEAVAALGVDLQAVPIVSLAVALREAVRSVRENPATSSSYCWAPFVLHGSWFCRAI